MISNSESPSANSEGAERPLNIENSEEFSSRDTFDLRPDFEKANETQNRSLVPDMLSRDERKALFARVSFARCRDSFRVHNLKKTETDRSARAVLLTIAETALDDRFDLIAFSRLDDWPNIRISKAVQKNPFRPLILAANPNRDPKVASKQSKALMYALEICENDLVRLAEYFETHSIKQCLSDRAAKNRLSDRKRPTARKGMTIEGVPPNVHGIVFMKVEIKGDRVYCISVSDDFVDER